MKNPVTRVGAKPVPREQVRDLIQSDIKDMKFIRINDPPGTKPYSVNIEDISVGEGIDDKKGRKWPLYTRGSALIFNGQPVYFRYPDEKQFQLEPDKETETQQSYSDTMRTQISGGIF
jgi:hypothetical protein